METHAYFVHVGRLRLSDDNGSVDHDDIIAEVEDLTTEESKLLEHAIWQECEDPSIEVHMESVAVARKEMPKYLVKHRAAVDCQKFTKTLSRKKLCRDKFYRMARSALFHAEEIKKLRNPPGEKRLEQLTEADLICADEVDVEVAPRRPRLTVTFDPDQAIFDGIPYAIKSNGAAFLDSLLEANGEWVSGETIGVRADRVKKSLPVTIQHLIESSPGKGNRILSSALE